MQKSLFKNTFYKLMLNICNLVIPLLIGPYLSRAIEPAQYGMYNSVYAQLGFFLTFAGFGIYNYGVREVSKYRDDPKQLSSLFSSLFLIGIISNVIIGILYITFALQNSSGMKTIIYMIMLIQIIGNIFYIEFVNEAIENFGFIAKKTICIRILYFLAILMFIHKDSEVNAMLYAIITSLTVFLNNFVSYLVIRKHVTFDFSNIHIRMHLFPLLITLIYANAEMLYTQLDKVMIGSYIGDIPVTEYTMATTIIASLGIIPASLIAVAIPRLSHYIGVGDHVQFSMSLRHITAVYMGITLPICVGAFVLSEEILFLYSFDVYTYAYPVLMIACITRIVSSCFVVASNLVMYIHHMERRLMLYSLFGGVLNLIFNYLLVFTGIFTIETAALTTLLANLMESFMVILYTKKTLHVQYGFLSKQVLGYAIVCMLFIPIALLIKSFALGYFVNIVLIMSICILLYGIFLWIRKDPMLDIVCKKLHNRIS